MERLKGVVKKEPGRYRLSVGHNHRRIFSSTINSGTLKIITSGEMNLPSNATNTDIDIIILVLLPRYKKPHQHLDARVGRSNNTTALEHSR